MVDPTDISISPERIAENSLVWSPETSWELL